MSFPFLEVSMTPTKNNFIQNLNEYVHEEAEYCPTEESLKDFFNEIDTLRMDVDRMETKFNQMKEKILTGLEIQ